MRRLALSSLLFPGLFALAGCHQGYSANTYAATAAQQQAAVQRGVIIGVRQVMISPDGTIGAAAGGAAGGVAGAQIAGSPVVTAFGAIGGTLVGGISGAAAAQAVGETKGWEYIVQEDGNKLVSVTQTSKTALPIGMNVLVIAGSQQARIVPDYTVQTAAAPAAKPAAPDGAAPTEIDVGPLPAPAGTGNPFQIDPINTAGDATAQPAPAAPPAVPPAPAATPGKAVTPAADSASPVAGSAPAASAAAPVPAVPAAPVSTPPVSSAATP